MKRFHFPLRAVTVMRTHREVRAKLALADALQALEHAEAALAAAHARAAQTAAAIGAGRLGRFRAADETQFLALHRRECAAAADAEKHAAAARAETARRREECVEASRQLKVVTRLEENARSAHRLAWLAAEQQQMEELSRYRSEAQAFSLGKSAGPAETEQPDRGRLSPVRSGAKGGWQ
jgi:hypothetical protein